MAAEQQPTINNTKATGCGNERKDTTMRLSGGVGGGTQDVVHRGQKVGLLRHREERITR
jgi:hypothetical protein